MPEKAGFLAANLTKMQELKMWREAYCSKMSTVETVLS